VAEGNRTVSDMIDPDERDLAERTAAGCECPVNDSDACIAGTVYVPCDNENCGGVCEMAGTCGCPLHADPLHDSGYGGTFNAGSATKREGTDHV
jgi:hypothetical protein